MSLYAVHAPIGLVRFLDWRFDLPARPPLAVYLLVAIAAAILARWWDERARRLLAARRTVRWSAALAVL